MGILSIRLTATTHLSSKLVVRYVMERSKSGLDLLTEKESPLACCSGAVIGLIPRETRPAICGKPHSRDSRARPVIRAHVFVHNSKGLYKINQAADQKKAFIYAAVSPRHADRRLYHW